MIATNLTLVRQPLTQSESDPESGLHSECQNCGFMFVDHHRIITQVLLRQLPKLTHELDLVGY